MGRFAKQHASIEFHICPRTPIISRSFAMFIDHALRFAWYNGQFVGG
jgi:hypothetical protein